MVSEGDEAAEQLRQGLHRPSIPEAKILDRTWIRKGNPEGTRIDAGDGRVSKIAFKSYEQGREKAQGAGIGDSLKPATSSS